MTHCMAPKCDAGTDSYLTPLCQISPQDFYKGRINFNLEPRPSGQPFGLDHALVSVLNSLTHYYGEHALLPWLHNFCLPASPPSVCLQR